MKSWDGQCSTPCNKNEGPFCHDKWSMVCDGMERVAKSAGFWDEGTMKPMNRWNVIAYDLYPALHPNVPPFIWLFDPPHSYLAIV